MAEPSRFAENAARGMLRRGGGGEPTPDRRPGALPAVAAAADYCVAPRTGCSANDVGSLEAAIDLAEGTAAADRILPGAATYVATDPNEFRYSNEVADVASGAGPTVHADGVTLVGSGGNPYGVQAYDCAAPALSPR